MKADPQTVLDQFYADVDKSGELRKGAPGYGRDSFVATAAIGRGKTICQAPLGCGGEGAKRAGTKKSGRLTQTSVSVLRQ
jgi:hypothetical protein